MKGKLFIAGVGIVEKALMKLGVGWMILLKTHVQIDETRGRSTRRLWVRRFVLGGGRRICSGLSLRNFRCLFVYLPLK